MKILLSFAILSLLSLHSAAQLISRFTWENNPVTNAASGPNAISVGTHAVSSAYGTGSSKGLNPGSGNNDINLVLDGASFNVPALDISVDFRREESQASFFYRGSYFNFGMNGGYLSVSFQLTNGTSALTINSGNVYAVPDDHSFHNYQFNYDDNTGIARVWVDAVLKYTYTGTAGRPLYWTGAGNITIGKDMDATGRNLAILDNLAIQKYANALLPLKLLSFAAEAKNKYVVINCATTEETSLQSIVLERSNNGIVFSPVATMAAAGGYSSINHYQFTDSLPLGPVAYYRVKMINTDGSASYSDIKSVAFDALTISSISVFPNPATEYVIVKMNTTRPGKFRYTVLSVSGQPLTTKELELGNGIQQIKIDLTKTVYQGALFIQITNIQANSTATFSIVKR
ncbi:MAG: hypothetical protein ABI813_15580 [Bacteroidota bacterium]